MIYLLFGEMGVGKNYVGERLAKYLGCPFFDGDEVVPEEMSKKVKKFRFLSDKTITAFVKDNLIPEINKRAEETENLVVGQALYKKKYRDMIIESNVKVTPIQIIPPSIRLHIARIAKRKNGIKWAAYCLFSKPFFQKDQDLCPIIMNDNDINLNWSFNELVQIMRKKQ